MNRKLNDISGKIEPSLVSALFEINQIANILNIDFMVIGATARDILLEHLYKIPSPRMTKDIDIAVCVGDWEGYHRLTDALLDKGCFAKGNQKQRYISRGMLIDILPFGDISDSGKAIFWPPEYGTRLSILGFNDVHSNSILFRLSHDPILDVKLPTLPGLAILKLLAWNDGYPERQKDAEDLLFIMRKYQLAGIEDRLYGAEAGLLEEEKFDLERAGIRLLGRDMARISSADTASAIKGILASETGTDSKYRLVIHMESPRNNFETVLAFLEKLKQGFCENHEQIA